MNLVKNHTQAMPTRHGLCVIVTKLKKNSGIAEGYFTMYKIEEIVSDITIL